jgi:peptidoglycan/LPS O-acetylase OafA/YrhL
MNVRARRYPLVDSLRAIAAMMVVCAHALPPAGADREGTFSQEFLARFSVCVAMFFVISGFLIYRPFVRARLLDKPRPDLRSYAVGRVLRIVPAYWVALTIIAIWLGRSDVFGDEWWAYYSFAQIYIGEPLGGIAAAWSLCIEVVFYAAIPFYALLMARLPGRTQEARIRGELIGLAVIFVVAYVFRTIIGADGLSLESSVDVAPVTFLDWFALGMLLAVLTAWLDGRDGELPGWLRPFDRYPGILWGAAALAFIGDSLYFDGKILEYTLFENLLEHTVYGFIAFALITPLTFGDRRRGLTRRALDNRVLLYMGLVSYGIFLWHEAIVQQLVRWNFMDVVVIHPYLTWAVTTIALATLVATVSYYGIERPVMRLRTKIVRPRTPIPRGEAIAEPTPAAPMTARESA